MSVVLRCPHCGTTRGSSGECEACHEAQVRYFCMNHTPGVWLDAPACPKCSARFGEPARRASTPARTSPVRARPPAPARAPVTTSAPPAAYSRSVPPERSVAVARSRERLPPAGDEEFETGSSRLAPWREILRAAVRARTMPRGPAPEHERPRIGRNVGGCLMRLVLLVVLLFVALVGALFYFGQVLL